MLRAPVQLALRIDQRLDDLVRELQLIDSREGPTPPRELGKLIEHLVTRPAFARHLGRRTALDAAVAGLEQHMAVPRGAPPHLQWWNASDDGRAYQGWDNSLRVLREALERHPGAGVLGFSQGAAVAAAVAALSCHGQLPALRFAVLVAGFIPRAAELAPLFEGAPLDLPSLHVWGTADPIGKHGPALADKFSAATRQVLTWPGGHKLPGGEVGEALVEFVRRHAVV